MAGLAVFARQIQAPALGVMGHPALSVTFERILPELMGTRGSVSSPATGHAVKTLRLQRSQPLQEPPPDLPVLSAPKIP